ncbi:MAG TPA: hypothetical protein V6C85_18530 [Allocoleopsis sp.]
MKEPTDLAIFGIQIPEVRSRFLQDNGMNLTFLEWQLPDRSA